jgi:hypothetical protein
MTPFSHAIHQIADVVGRLFNRFAALIVGFILTMVGLGMTASIVMLPVGVILGLLGVAIFLVGLFPPADGARPQGDR